MLSTQGNLTQNVISGTTQLGTGVLSNAVLYPFYNSSYPLLISVDLGAALQNLTQIIASQIGPIINGKVSLTTNNNSTVYDGQDLDYYHQPLYALKLPIELDLANVLGTLNVNLTAPTSSGNTTGNGTAVGIGGLAGLLGNDTGNGTAGGLGGLAGLLGNGSAISGAIQGFLQGIGNEAGPSLGAILSGLLGGFGPRSMNRTSPITGIRELDDSTVLEG